MKIILLVTTIFLLLSCNSQNNQTTQEVKQIQVENNNLISENNNSKVTNGEENISEVITGEEAISSEEQNKIKELQSNVVDAFNQGKYEEAIVIYEELLQLNQVTAEVLHNLFYSYIMVGKYNNAVGIIQYLISISGPDESLVGGIIEQDNLSNQIVNIQDKLILEGGETEGNLIEYAKLLYTAGDYYYELDQEKYYFAIFLHYLTAYIVLDDVEIMNPNNSEVYYLKGRLLMDIGNDFAKSEELLLKSISLKQDDFRYYYRLGNAYMHQDKYEKAKDSFLQGIELEKNYEKLYLNLGNMYFDLGEDDKGFAEYEKGINICVTHCDGFYHNMGNHYYHNQDNTNAIYWYKKVSPSYTSYDTDNKIIKELEEFQ